MAEKNEVLLGNRVSKQLHARIVVEQKRLEKETGLQPSVNEVVRMLIVQGLERLGEKRGKSHGHQK